MWYNSDNSEQWNKKKKFTLSKKERIKSRKEIENLFSCGKRFKYDNLLIIYLPTVEQKAGFLVSKQIRSAVKRNRVKRVLKEVYRMQKEKFKGLAVLFYAQAPVEIKDIYKAIAKFGEMR